MACARDVLHHVRFKEDAALTDSLLFTFLFFSSIWSTNKHATDDIKIDMEEFESLFVEKLGKKEAPKKKVVKKEPQVVSLLERKRSMNISIATASIKMSYGEI